MKNVPITLLIIAIGLVLFVTVVAFFLFSNAQTSPGTSVRESILTPTTNQDGHSMETAGKEPLPLQSPNPTFTQLLKTQPFWDMLPHYGENYLVEYKQSDEKIVITTIDPGGVANREQLINQYRQEARTWLTQNGAVLNELTIEYVPDNL